MWNRPASSKKRKFDMRLDEDLAKGFEIAELVEVRNHGSLSGRGGDVREN